MRSTFPIKTCVSTLALSILLAGCGADATADLPLNQSRPVNVIQLTAQDNLQTLRFSGVIQSHQTADVAFRVPGTIDKILVKEGEQVKAGQIIASLDPHDFQVDVNELSARLEEAKAAHKLAAIELQRTNRASADGAIADINLDRASSAESRALAGVKMLEQSLKKAQDALAYSQLKAPFDGVIGQRYADEYEQTSPHTPILSIHQPAQLEAVVDVPDKQIALIHTGMQASVEWFQQSEPVKAVSTAIATLPDALKRTYPVTFALQENAESLFPGKAVNVSVSIASQSPTFCLPASAVKSHAGQPQVVKVASGQAWHTPVTVVNQRQDSLCVSGHLSMGDYIVTAGSAFISEGQTLSHLREVGAKS